MKNILIIMAFMFSTKAFSAGYLGVNYGYNAYSSAPLEKYKITPKASNYGGYIGIEKNFLGLEFIYQNLQSEGKIKHDGGSYTIKENATAFGGALRFSFRYIYLRFGLANYTLNQSVDITDETIRRAAESIYEIKAAGTKRSGSLYGFGVHQKFMATTLFADYTRYQVSSIGYFNTFSLAISFPIPINFFELKN